MMKTPLIFQIFLFTLHLLNFTASSFPRERKHIREAIRHLAGFDYTPPSLYNAVFIGGGSVVIAIFNKATDQGLIKDNTWSCSQIFDFSEAVSSTCTWLNSTSVEISLSYTSQLSFQRPSNTVTLLSETVKAYCTESTTICSTNSYATGNKVFLQTPANVPKPIPIIIAPHTMSTCDYLLLDASTSSGSAGRPFTISWTVTYYQDGIFTDTEIENYLNSITTISKPILVNYTLNTDVTYEFTINLSNIFGQTASYVHSIVVDKNIYIPYSIILGSPSFMIYYNDPLILKTSSRFSICSNNSSFIMNYQWILKNQMGEVYIPDNQIENTSKNPAEYRLDGYTLGTYYPNYSVEFIASVLYNNTVMGQATYSVQFTVVPGVIIASIIGGDKRQQPIDKDLILDASSSRDMNFPSDYPEDILAFAWTCYKQIPTNPNSHEKCTFSQYGISDYTTSPDTLNSSTQDKIKTIPAVELLADTIYLFTVYVDSFGSSAQRVSANTIITIVPAGSVVITPITSNSVKFNENTQFSISATLNASTAFTATWSLFLDQNTVTLQALSPITRTFTNITTSISYPLIVPPNALVPSRQYRYRLTAYPTTQPNVTTFIDIYVTIVSAPKSGSVQITPTTGYALSTDFTIYATNWISDNSDGTPFTYSFTYEVSSNSPVISIAKGSSESSVVSKLPPGLSSNQYSITVYCKITNTFGGSTTASTTVRVDVNNSVSVHDYTTYNINEAQNSGDFNRIYQTIGSATTIFNTFTCVYAPSCTALNRYPCTSVSNTCGPCISGYVGLPGASNIPCVLSSSAVGVGSSCSSNNQCITNTCVHNICISPSKSCPSNNPSTVCSNHGTCIYYNSVNEVITSCSVSKTACTARCTCTTGYGGIDCSLTSAEINSRDSTRSLLCTTLTSIIPSQNPSYDLVTSITTSILSTYSPIEVQSQTTLTNCLSALLSISQIAGDGYLSDQYTHTPISFLNAISAFATLPDNSNLIIDENIIDTILYNFHLSYHYHIQLGQDPVDFISSNTIPTNVFRTRIYYQYEDEYNNMILSPSYSDTSTTLQSSIQLPSTGLSVCNLPNGKGRVSITNMNQNIYTTDNSTRSNTIRFSLFYDASVNNSGSNSGTSNIANVKYYITLPFSTTQNLNRNELLTATSLENVSNVPQCTILDPTTGVSTPCSDCTLYDVTNDKVVYECTNMINLCESASQRRRRRQLATTDDASSLSSQSHSTSVFYSILLNIKNEFTSIFSLSAFRVDPQTVISVLTFMSILLFALLFGLIYFIRWDYLEHNHLLLIAPMKKRNSIGRLSFSQSSSRSIRMFGYGVTVDTKRNSFNDSNPLTHSNADQDVNIDNQTPENSDKFPLDNTALLPVHNHTSHPIKTTTGTKTTTTAATTAAVVAGRESNGGVTDHLYDSHHRESMSLTSNIFNSRSRNVSLSHSMIRQSPPKSRNSEPIVNPYDSEFLHISDTNSIVDSLNKTQNQQMTLNIHETNTIDDTVIIHINNDNNNNNNNTDSIMVNQSIVTSHNTLLPPNDDMINRPKLHTKGRVSFYDTQITDSPDDHLTTGHSTLVPQNTDSIQIGMSSRKLEDSTDVPSLLTNNHVDGDGDINNPVSPKDIDTNPLDFTNLPYENTVHNSTQSSNGLHNSTGLYLQPPPPLSNKTILNLLPTSPLTPRAPATPSNMILYDILHIFFPRWVFYQLPWYNIFPNILIKTHDYMAMFFGEASFTYTRALRFLYMFTLILTSLFFDTLFYKISYPDNGLCESIYDEITCLSVRSSITNVRICNYDTSNGGCIFNDPQNNVIFIIIITLLVITWSLPFNMMFQFIIENICAKRPDFSVWGWKTDLKPKYWHEPEIKDMSKLEPELYHLKELFNNTQVFLASNISQRSMKLPTYTYTSTRSVHQPTTTNAAAHISNIPMTYHKDNRPISTSLSHKGVEYDKQLSARGVGGTAGYSHKNETKQDIHVIHTARSQPYSQPSQDSHDIHISHSNSHIESEQDEEQDEDEETHQGGEENDEIQMTSRENQQIMEVTAEKESILILNRLQTFVKQQYIPAIFSPSWFTHRTNIHAIFNMVKLYPDGTPIRLSFYQVVKYGTHTKMFEYKIALARKKTEKLKKKLEQLKGCQVFYNDALLLQTFIREQLNYYERYLYDRNPLFEDHLIQSIHPLIWILGWLVLIGVLSFFMSYIILWGLANGGKTFDIWGSTYATAFVTDFTVNNALSSYFLCYFGSKKLRFKLLSIYQILIDATERALNRHHEQHLVNYDINDINAYSPHRIPMDIQNDKSNKTDIDDENDKLSINNDLNSHTSNDNDDKSTHGNTNNFNENKENNSDHDDMMIPLRICQHIYASCRLANQYKNEFSTLSAIKILNEIRDIDIEKIQYLYYGYDPYYKKVNFLFFLMIIIPAILFTVFPLLGESFVKFMIPPMTTSFLLINSVVSEVSFILLISIYVTLLFFSYIFFIYRVAKYHESNTNNTNLDPLSTKTTSTSKKSKSIAIVPSTRVYVFDKIIEYSDYIYEHIMYSRDDIKLALWHNQNKQYAKNKYTIYSSATSPVSPSRRTRPMSLPKDIKIVKSVIYE